MKRNAYQLSSEVRGALVYWLNATDKFYDFIMPLTFKYFKTLHNELANIQTDDISVSVNRRRGAIQSEIVEAPVFFAS